MTLLVGILVVAAALQAFAATTSGELRYLVIALSAIVMLVIIGGLVWLARAGRRRHPE